MRARFGVIEGVLGILGKKHDESKRGCVGHAWQVAWRVLIFGSLGGRLVGDVHEKFKTVYWHVSWEDQGGHVVK